MFASILVAAAVLLTPPLTWAQSPDAGDGFTLPTARASSASEAVFTGDSSWTADPSPFCLPGLAFDFYQSLPAPPDDQAQP
jgi:hypothetical protein